MAGLRLLRLISFIELAARWLQNFDVHCDVHIFASNEPARFDHTIPFQPIVKPIDRQFRSPPSPVTARTFDNPVERSVERHLLRRVPYGEIAGNGVPLVAYFFNRGTFELDYGELVG